MTRMKWNTKVWQKNWPLLWGRIWGGSIGNPPGEKNYNNGHIVKSLQRCFNGTSSSIQLQRGFHQRGSHHRHRVCRWWETCQKMYAASKLIWYEFTSKVIEWNKLINTVATGVLSSSLRLSLVWNRLNESMGETTSDEHYNIGCIIKSLQRCLQWNKLIHTVATGVSSSLLGLSRKTPSHERTNTTGMIKSIFGRINGTSLLCAFKWWSHCRHWPFGSEKLMDICAQLMGKHEQSMSSGWD